jgi:predicted nuclease of predicted toxin-antitoxin system
MNFLADENFPNSSIFLLEKNNHIVRKVSVLFKGILDSEIISMALSRNEIVIAFDKDFGELIFKEQPPLPFDIVLFRLNILNQTCQEKYC